MKHTDDINPALGSKVQYLFFSGGCPIVKRTSEIQFAVLKRVDVGKGILNELGCQAHDDGS